MTAKYAFNNNLLQLSMNEDIELAKKEWILIRKDKTPNKDGICICQHTIKNIVYCYNIKTKRYISVGLVCCKKFQLKLKSGNKLLIKVFDEMFEKGFDEIFEKGEKIIDSYTKEVLGNVETSKGQVAITQVTSNYTKAKFLKKTDTLEINFIPGKYLVRPIKLDSKA